MRCVVPFRRTTIHVSYYLCNFMAQAQTGILSSHVVFLAQIFDYIFVPGLAGVWLVYHGEASSLTFLFRCGRKTLGEMLKLRSDCINLMFHCKLLGVHVAI